MREDAPLSITRHSEELTESETDEVVGIVADLVVAYLRKQAGPTSGTPRGCGPTSASHRKEIVP
jgi:hypothetical protein